MHPRPGSDPQPAPHERRHHRLRAIDVVSARVPVGAARGKGVLHEEQHEFENRSRPVPEASATGEVRSRPVPEASATGDVWSRAVPAAEACLRVGINQADARYTGQLRLHGDDD